jgi:hypothetical protein
MASRNASGFERMTEVRKSGFGNGAKRLQNLDISSACLGQSYPQHYPHLEGPIREIGAQDVLGEPLSIRGVARLLGCSVWTVRQRYLPAGLPHFRSGRHGKFVFYRNQVVLWILENQRRKGGEL